MHRIRLSEHQNWYNTQECPFFKKKNMYVLVALLPEVFFHRERLKPAITKILTIGISLKNSMSF